MGLLTANNVHTDYDRYLQAMSNDMMIALRLYDSDTTVSIVGIRITAVHQQNNFTVVHVDDDIFRVKDSAQTISKLVGEAVNKRMMDRIYALENDREFKDRYAYYCARSGRDASNDQSSWEQKSIDAYMKVSEEAVGRRDKGGVSGVAIRNKHYSEGKSRIEQQYQQYQEVLEAAKAEVLRRKKEAEKAAAHGSNYGMGLNKLGGQQNLVGTDYLNKYMQDFNALGTITINLEDMGASKEQIAKISTMLDAKFSNDATTRQLLEGSIALDGTKAEDKDGKKDT